MTREELKRHCEKQVEGCEMWARYNGEDPGGKVYEEHKLILELLEENEDFQKYIDKANYTNSQLIQLIEKHKMNRDISDDCVSRQVVTDAVENTIAKYIPIFIGQYEKIPLEVAMAIKDVPPATPTQKWISVNEKLPKEGETVLVCYQAQGGIAQSVCEWFDIPNRGIVWSTLCGRTPIAWMPLPEPYKAEMESEE